MFKFIKRFFGLDYSDTSTSVVEDKTAPVVNTPVPEAVVEILSKPKEKKPRKPAAKKAAPKKAVKKAK